MRTQSQSSVQKYLTLANALLFTLLLSRLWRRLRQQPSAVFPTDTTNSSLNTKPISAEKIVTNPVANQVVLWQNSLHPPNPVIQNMYLEITNIAQALNIGVFLLIIIDPDFYAAIPTTFFSAPLFAITNLIISVIFWSRYYFDTEILRRSYTTLSTLWFFIYVLAQGISISVIRWPAFWLAGTGIFLLFAAGFYVLNLAELKRKQAAGILPEWPNFVAWQSRRLIDLIVIAALTLGGANAVRLHPPLALPAAIMAFLVAIWQLWATNDYRRHRFLRTGI